MTIEFRSCGRCKSDKPIEEFGNTKSNYYCRPCRAQYMRDRRARMDPEIRRAEDRAYYAKNPKKMSAKQAAYRARGLQCAPEEFKARSLAWSRAWRAKNPGINKSLQRRYSILKSRAKKHALTLEITIEMLAELVKLPCVYCGGALAECGYGLDRMDNNLGYTVANCVPCCKVCNAIKSDEFTYSEMMEIGVVLRRIAVARAQVTPGSLSA